MCLLNTFSQEYLHVLFFIFFFAWMIHNTHDSPIEFYLTFHTFNTQQCRRKSILLKNWHLFTTIFIRMYKNTSVNTTKNINRKMFMFNTHIFFHITTSQRLSASLLQIFYIFFYHITNILNCFDSFMCATYFWKSILYSFKM